jgi:hypothetical protein
LTLAAREKKALIVWGAAVVIALIVYLTLPEVGVIPAQTARINNVQIAQQRATRLRQLAALAPAREATMRQVANDLADRERGLVPGDTAAEAQAAVLEVARNVGKGNQIDVRSGDFPAAKPFGDYGMVYASVTFECHIEQLVNFLSDLAKQNELVVPTEERINAGAQKQKLINVRLVLAGVVAKKLIPEKKGLGAL